MNYTTTVLIGILFTLGSVARCDALGATSSHLTARSVHRLLVENMKKKVEYWDPLSHSEKFESESWRTQHGVAFLQKVRDCACKKQSRRGRPYRPDYFISQISGFFFIMKCSIHNNQSALVAKEIFERLHDDVLHRCRLIKPHRRWSMQHKDAIKQYDAAAVSANKFGAKISGDVVAALSETEGSLEYLSIKAFLEKLRDYSATADWAKKEEIQFIAQARENSRTPNIVYVAHDEHFFIR